MKILVELGKALLPLKKALSSPEEFYSFLLEMGWEPDDIPEPIKQIGGGVDMLLEQLLKITGEGLSLDGSATISSDGISADISLDTISSIKQAIENIINGIKAIEAAPDALIPAKLRNDGFKTEFPKQLLDRLFIEYVNDYQPRLAFALQSLGVIRSKYVPVAGTRPPHIQYRIDFRDLPKVLTNPSLLLQNAFGWGTDDFDFNEFLFQLENLLMGFDVDVFIDKLESSISNKIDTGNTSESRRNVMRGVFFERARDGGRLAAEVRLLGLQKSGTAKPGIAILPMFNGVFDLKMALAEDLSASIQSQLDLQGGVGIVLRPEQGIEVITGFNNPGLPMHASGRISAIIERANANNTPTIVIGSAGGTRLEYKKLGGKGGLSLDAQNGADIFAEFEAQGLKFVLKPEGDGFIKKLLPEDGISLESDLAIGISHKQGFYFRGTSHLEISLPVHIKVAIIELQALNLGIVPHDDSIEIDLGVTLKGDLGPLKAVVENIGLTADFSFPANNGNLGFLNLDLGFKPPTGVGLSVDAGVVKGGGYLAFDNDKKEYSGALELTFSEIVSLKAIGIITTRMPDGSDGFSLLIIITAEFGTGIQLGFGFVLLGVGGLLGLNRTMRLQPLAEGVRTGGINGIMFPKDVVANAPRIISDLRNYFPPEEGKFLIGPMAKLGWGTPALISISLGVIIEIPGNIAIVGIMKIALPTEEAPLIVIQINFIGAIEFDKSRLWFFASVYESRILFATIEGEMGLLVAWGDDANFVASVGGFHPSFNPPPLPFPSPVRLSFDVMNEPVGRIRVMAYFAVTSNTAQFGASAELFFGLSSFNINGHIGFDALFQFSPFHFIIELSASVSVEAFGVGCFSIRVRMALEGPSPYRAKGHGSISLFFFDISVPFDITWGESQNTTLPPIQVMPLMKAEFNKIENWKALLPPGNNLLVSLRPLNATTELILHPIGTLQISQRYVPLHITIDKIGSQKPSDVKKFTLTPQGTSGLAKKKDVKESFPIAQFQDMSDADKLSRPSYQKEDGGLELSVSGQDVKTGKAVKRIVRYELIVIDSNFKRFVRKFTDFISGVLFLHFLKGNAVANSVLSQKSKTQYQPFNEKIEMKQDAYSVASVMDNKPFSASGSFTSEAQAREFMHQQLQADPNLQGTIHVIPHNEINSAA